MHKYVVLLIAGLTMGLHATLARGAGEHDFNAFGQEMAQAVDEGVVPSLAVVVAQHGKILWEAGHGWAAREQR